MLGTASQPKLNLQSWDILEDSVQVGKETEVTYLLKLNKASSLDEVTFEFYKK